MADEHMTRHMLREKVFQLLFQLEFQPMDQIVIDPSEEWNDEDKNEIISRVQKIYDAREDLDALINQCSRGWKTTRMSKVDLTILRLAAYEIRMDDELPDSVAANEAVELAKTFSSDDASGFVNGVISSMISTKETV